uniref:DUF4283 domain-containing protein n=1 Tax=Quercus lobata TaxID=97700 RepID=A0A7N2N1I1_QUELO
MDELTKQWSGLTISQREGPKVRLQNEMAASVSIIAAKFLTKRALNPEAVAATFTPIWRSKRGFKIKNLGNHIMLFSFDSETEVDTILANAPWSFDKHLMILQKYDGCGCLTHNDRDCDRWIESEGSLTDADKEYGAWLKASPWSGARNSVVEVPGFYSKMKAERTGQRRSDEATNSMAARVTPLTPPSDLPQAQYGNSYFVSVMADSFQNNSIFVSMLTDSVLVENNTADPTPLHTDPGPISTLNLTFDKQLEAIDQDLMKFDHPRQVSPLTPTPHYHMSSPYHHEQDVDTPNLITILSDPPPTLSTYSSNSNIPTNPISPPHPSHISSWKRILKAIVAHTHNLSTFSGSKRALNEDQPELPSKRHAVSQVGEENTQILAEAGYQPY